MHHPDSGFRCYVLEGIKWDFQIGFDHSSPLESSCRNMPSTASQPAAIKVAGTGT